MNDLELELLLLQRYTQHFDSVGPNPPKCGRELDMEKVISDIIGRPVEEAVVQRWHNRLAPPLPFPPGILRPCSDSTKNKGPHRFYARAYYGPGSSPAWDRIAELENMLNFQSASQSPKKIKSSSHNFVSENRIAELRALTPINFDLRKLICLCKEINITFDEGALLATAMLTRAILDHVPPIFSQSSFSMVVNNYAGSRSFKETMDRLERAARKISDGYLHCQIRNKEVLPEPQQVNFSAEVDVLLAEIVRILS